MVLSRTLERDPARRFETAQDLAAALRVLQSGSGALSSSLTRRPRLRGKSLAVLPFLNAGVDPRFEYLTELQRHAQALANDPQLWMPWNYRGAPA